MVANDKITHIVSSLNIGGAERFVIDLSEVQIRRGAQVTICSFGTESEPLVARAIAAGANVMCSNSRKFRWLARLHLQLFKSSIVHIHSPYALKSLMVLLAVLPKRRVVYTRHNADQLSSSSWRTIHRIARLFVDVITFVSVESHKNFNVAHKWPGTKLVVANGVGIPVNSRDLNTGSPTRLGMVGRMVPLKRQDSLIDAMDRLQPDDRESFEVNIFGDGECRQEIEKLAARSKVAGSIRFWGNVPNRNDIYENIDVLVVTSETEGLSIAILEAMSFGIPIIATKVGGNLELVLDNETGRLISYDSPQELADVLCQVAASPSIIERWGLASRQRIIDNYSIENSANNYEKIYAS